MVLDPQELWHQGAAVAIRRMSCCHVVTQQTRCNPSSSSWQVWQDALDLTQSSGSGEVECFFHYTTQLGFRNITAPQKKAVEVFVLHSVTNQHVM